MRVASVGLGLGNVGGRVPDPTDPPIRQPAGLVVVGALVVALGAATTVAVGVAAGRRRPCRSDQRPDTACVRPRDRHRRLRAAGRSDLQPHDRDPLGGVRVGSDPCPGRRRVLDRLLRGDHRGEVDLLDPALATGGVGPAQCARQPRRQRLGPVRRRHRVRTQRDPAPRRARSDPVTGSGGPRSPATPCSSTRPTTGTSRCARSPTSAPTSSRGTGRA